MQMMIKDFIAGDRIEGFYLIKALNLKTSSNNKKYLDLMLADRSGEVNAKIWDVDEEIERQYQQGDIIKVRGDVTLWMDQLQLKIIRTRPLEYGEEVDYEALIPSAPLKSETMLKFIQDEVARLDDVEIKRLLEHVIGLHRDKLLYYPAAMRNHHAIRGGLLYHLYRMIQSGQALCQIYQLNWNLLLAGILLHDIDKLNEMDANELGIVSGYTADGQLLGHIVTGVVAVERWCQELGISDEIRRLIQHMILSHHYEPEYGSPKKPHFAEAELLHHLDMIDARIYDIEKATGELAPGSFSEPIFSLERRRVYRPNIED